MYKILIVEDDPQIASALARHLSGWGWQTLVIEDFQQVLETFVAFAPQLVLLDIALPFRNGYHWCAEIRKVSQVPILFLSSAAENMNMVMAMQMGGDDFVPKPVDPDVLSAKIQALLRRTYEFTGTTALIAHRGAVLDLAGATLTYQEEALALSKNELRILEVLMLARGQVVSRDTLMTRLWQTDSYIDDNTLTVNVTRLRQKLAQIGLCDWIGTKKGMGYQLL